MPDSVGSQTAGNTCDGVAREPCRVPERLLGALIPHCHDGGETGGNGRLANAQEEAEGEQVGSLGGYGCQHQHHAPKNAGPGAC